MLHSGILDNVLFVIQFRACLRSFLLQVEIKVVVFVVQTPPAPVGRVVVGQPLLWRSGIAGLVQFPIVVLDKKVVATAGHDLESNNGWDVQLKRVALKAGLHFTALGDAKERQQSGH